MRFYLLKTYHFFIPYFSSTLHLNSYIFSFYSNVNQTTYSTRGFSKAIVQSWGKIWRYDKTWYLSKSCIRLAHRSSRFFLLLQRHCCKCWLKYEFPDVDQSNRFSAPTPTVLSILRKSYPGPPVFSHLFDSRAKIPMFIVIIILFCHGAFPLSVDASNVQEMSNLTLYSIYGCSVLLDSRCLSTDTKICSALGLLSY